MSTHFLLSCVCNQKCSSFISVFIYNFHLEILFSSVSILGVLDSLFLCLFFLFCFHYLNILIIIILHLLPNNSHIYILDGQLIFCVCVFCFVFFFAHFPSLHFASYGLFIFFFFFFFFVHF